MKDDRPTWALVVDAARRLTARGISPFRLGEIVAEVQRMDPSRQRTSIQPVVQGMTRNAGKGPGSPGGKPLVRVAHGLYELASRGKAVSGQPIAGGSAPPQKRPRAQRPHRRNDAANRIDALIEGFDFYADVYDDEPPFRRSGQQGLHRSTIDRRHALGSVRAAVHDEEFLDSLHATLQAWGVGRRASRLVPAEEFSARIRVHAARLQALDGLSIERTQGRVDQLVHDLYRLIGELGVVENKALIVAGTKTLHHLLPDLVPPMDRRWTGAFFGWTALDAQNYQESTFAEAYAAMCHVAQAVRPSRLVGPGWRTSPTKVLDNAIIGYGIYHGLGGAPNEKRLSRYQAVPSEAFDSEKPLTDGDVGEPHPPTEGCWTLEELRAKLRQWEAELTADGYPNSTVSTYIGRNEVFLRWLVGDWRPSGPRS